jgi:hypothetical protein
VKLLIEVVWQFTLNFLEYLFVIGFGFSMGYAFQLHPFNPDLELPNWGGWLCGLVIVSLMMAIGGTTGQYVRDALERKYKPELKTHTLEVTS